MPYRFLTILTGRNLPKIRQPRGPEPSIIDEKTIADFTRVVEQTGILEREPLADEGPQGGPAASGAVRPRALKSSTRGVGGGLVVASGEGATMIAVIRCVAPSRPRNLDRTSNSELTNREARAAVVSIEVIQPVSLP